MKKTLLLTLALLLSVTIFAQSRSVLLRETFDSMSLPTGWTVSDNSTDNWSISTTNRAGGEANELKFSAEPKSVGTSRIITTPIDLSGLSTVTMSFRHFFDKKTYSAVIGIATSSNNGQTWNAAWSQSYSEAGQYNVIASLKNNDMGKDNVLFCIYFQGNSTNINNWYFDDIEITSMEAIDAKAQSIDLGDIIPAGENTVSFSVQNTGSDVITSFEAEFSMSDQVITESFETELGQYETKQFTFNKTIKLTPNNYNSEIKITSVNGTEDQNEVNNTVRKNIRVALGKTNRLPMIEHFSSSTCASCVILDGTMKELLANNPGKYVYTKYTMNWPSPGDPYYTEDGGIRKNFYNVGSVPFLSYNGKGRSYNAVTQEELEEICNMPAFIEVKGSFNTEGNNINVVADIMSYIDINEVKVHVSVNEKKTTKNVGTNGLTEFHHVMMKMLPDAKGSTTDFKAGEYQRFEFTYDMSKTFVEEMEDLEVSVWIQDIATKEILNSRYLYEYCQHPYPVQNLQLTNANNLTISWEAPEKGNPVAYNLYVNNELALENTTELSYTIEDADGFYGVEVVALYENNIASIGVADKIIVGCKAPINIEYVLEPFAENFDYKHKVTLTWDEIDEADFYTVYVNGEKVGDTEETTFVTGFDKSGTYVYTITSSCNSEESEHSEECVVYLNITGIEETNLNCNIYPNPVKDILYIETETEIEEVMVYDVYGRVQNLRNSETQKLRNSIDISNLKSGIYFVKINTEKGNIVKRIIKD